MKTILVTGGAGFIGSNFICHYLQNNADTKILNLDLLTYAGTLENLQDVHQHPHYEFIQGDICDRPLLESIFSAHDIQGVIHLAAESHVDNSISSPDQFIRTNVLGTFNLLDVARNSWMDGPFKKKSKNLHSRFLHVSTDEVFGSLGSTGSFNENSSYAPNSPYSATKAGADHLVRSYKMTFGLNVITTHCSNNFGPRQHDEKLIPTIIRNALSLKSIPIYGDGSHIRDWIHVSDHNEALALIFEKGHLGETYLIGGTNEHSNLNLVQLICEIMDKHCPRKDHKPYKDLISFVADRPGHDQRYAVDSTKMLNELGWKSRGNFRDQLLGTIQWYLQN